MGEQRTLPAVDWVRCRQGDAGDVFKRPGAFFWRAAAEVPSGAGRIGAYDKQVEAAAEVFVPYAGGDHDYVAGLYVNQRTVLTAELHARRAARDSQHLVSGAVVVMKRVDAVAPAAAPAVGAETRSHTFSEPFSGSNNAPA